MPPKVDRILVPTDFSPLSRVAIDSAVSLFKDIPGTSITLLHVVEPMNLIGAAEPGMLVDCTLEKRLEAAEKELERLCTIYGGQAIFEARLLTGSPGRTLCDLAAEEHFDMIVLSSHGHTGLARILIGSVAERVVQEAQCPVMVVKLPRNELGQFLPDPVTLKMDRLLVGYDHRRGSDLALELALCLARRFNSKITLVHALEPAHFAVTTRLHDGLKKESVYVNEALTKLNEVRTRHMPASSDWELAVQMGHPWDVITACASKISSDAILVGPHDHTRWGHSFIGSTAQRVVRLAPCSVITVKQSLRAESICLGTDHPDVNHHQTLPAS